MKIMVSACLAGENCKYNGGNNRNEKVLRLMAGHEVITVCPERMGGLPTPRVPSEIRDGVVTAEDGRIVDQEFRLGAAKCLEIARRERPELIVLQSRSPSCGVKQHYDGSFTGTLADGAGVTAQLLMENGFRVIDVEDLITEEIRRTLFELQDLQYRDFQVKLIPGLAAESMIGVRTPALRRLAKQILKRDDLGIFLRDLPHKYFDENQIHAFVISEIKDFGKCMEELTRFLPFVNNWATCDQMSPKVFKKHKAELLPEIRKWLRSGHGYTVRFGIGMLMQHFLDEDFKTEYADLVAGIREEDYYIQMMIAWYFATALAKQYEKILPYIEERRLEPRVHRKTIQKAIESFRLTEEQKTYLRGLR